MKILTHKDLIVGFIKQNLQNKEHQKQIRQIFNNENSSFLFSKKFFLFIKEELGEEYKDEYSRLATKLIDSPFGTKVSTPETSNTFDEEFLHIFSAIQDRVVVSIACNQPSQEIQNGTPNIAVLSQQKKPNYHWLVVNLAVLHPNPILVRNYDFKDDKEVDKFFFDVFSIPRNIRFVSVFDDACNLDHKKFQFLTANRIRVFYYTVKLNISDSAERFNNLIKKFPVQMFGKPKGGHEREINFEGIIVIPTNDFWGLNITDDKKWSISILYSETESQKSLNFKDKYFRFLDRKWQG